MQEGQIVLAVLTADKELKKRPVLIVRKAPKHHDYLVCGITSKLHEETTGLDVVIDKPHPDFIESGLKHDGLIRLFFFAVIRSEDCLGTLGKVSDKTLELVQSRLANYIAGK